MEGNLHLLLLEDDQQLRTALESLLVDEGYQVATAADGREAVAQAAQQAPDILLLDVKLPGPDGLEVLKQLKQQLPELQSLVMTGYASEEDSIRAIRLGVGDYLQKPFPMADFLQAVESLTRRALRLKRLREKEEAVRDVTHWGLEFLTSSVDLAHPTEGESRRWAGEIAQHAAANLSFSAEAGRTLGPAVLYYLLSQESQQDRLNSLKALLPESVLHLAESIGHAGDEPLDEPSLLNLGLYLVARVEGREVKVDPQIVESVTGSPSAPAGRPDQRRSGMAILGLARTLAVSGDREGALEALQRLTESGNPSLVAGEALLLSAELEPDHLRDRLRTLMGWLPKLAAQEAATLQFKAGLLASERKVKGGMELLNRAVKTYKTLGLVGELACAGLALWVYEPQRPFEPHLELLLSPHRTDLLMNAAPWLLEPLLSQYSTPVARKAALRIVRESPKALLSAGRTEDTAAALLNCFEELGGGPENVVRRLLASGLSDELASNARQLLAQGSKIPLLRLLSFGSFELQIGETVLAGTSWAPQKARFLLACLAHTGRPTSQELLVEQFWPDSAPGRGLKNLYQALTDVRQAVSPNPDPITREGSMLKLSDEYPLWHDVSEFESALEQSEKASDLQAARELMYDALRLYRGPYLHDCPLDWAETQRRDLELKHSQLLERLLQCCFELERFREVETLANQLLQIDRCHQTANQMLMEAYVGLGRPEEAVRQYERAERALKNEFDMEPSIELFKSLQKAKMAM
jgi:two-component SAPR family response regulator